MQHTHEQKEEFKTKFSTRRRNQIVLVIPFVAVSLLLTFSEGEEAFLGVPWSIASSVGILLLLGAVAFSICNWRCPACSKSLGKAVSPKYCANCGVELS